MFSIRTTGHLIDALVDGGLVDLEESSGPALILPSA